MTARQDSLTAAFADSLAIRDSKNREEFEKVRAFIDKNRQEADNKWKNVAVCGACATVALAIAYVLAVGMIRRRRMSEEKALKIMRIDQSRMESSMCRFDGKLADLLDRQMETMQKSEVAPDHTLVLKVADEIARMEVNLSRMDSNVKGHKQLTKAIERIKNNMLAKGYEMTDMLGKSYNEGMRVVADFNIDETLDPGCRIITSVRKPEVLYNGEIIQKANIMVSQNI